MLKIDKNMRYIVRSLTYLVLLCVLYVALVWVSYWAGSEPQVSPWLQIEAQLQSPMGRVMVVAFVVLAALYPLFGFMRMRIEAMDLERDGVRLINAMQVYGYRLVEEVDGVKVFRADSFLGRLAAMWEDRIEVSVVDGVVELRGLRRTVARVGYQLRAYMHNSRFEQ